MTLDLQSLHPLPPASACLLPQVWPGDDLTTLAAQLAKQLPQAPVPPAVALEGQVTQATVPPKTGKALKADKGTPLRPNLPPGLAPSPASAVTVGSGPSRPAGAVVGRSLMAALEENVAAVGLQSPAPAGEQVREPGINF